MATLPRQDRDLRPLVQRLEAVLIELEATTNELRIYWQDRARRLGLNPGEGEHGRTTAAP
jgi:hypothetical protein